MAEIDAEQRIVVTGMGCVSPVGMDVESTWQSIEAGQAGIRNIDDDILADFPQIRAHVAATVDGFLLDSHPVLGGRFNDKELRPYHRSAQFAVWAGAEALSQAGILLPEEMKIDPSQVDPDRVAIRMGTGIGGAEELGPARMRLNDGNRVALPVIMRVLPERVATTMSMLYGAKASVHTAIGACATGNINIIAGAQLLQLRQADMVIVGGTEAQITPEGIALFDGTSALDKTKDPNEASSPFSQRQAGFVMGEGAGVLVLESLAHARKRGAVVLAELVGYGETADAHHPTAPSGFGAVRAMDLARGWYGFEGRGYVNAHATGTKTGDGPELNAIGKVLRRDQVAGISSTKSMTGHTLGAASAVESIISIKALQEGVIPPSIKLGDPIPETEGWNMSPDTATREPLDFALNNSFGFGGLNAVTHWRK